MKFDCTVCGQTLNLPVETKSRPVQPVDGPHAIYLEIDAAPFREHLIAVHSGPDGDGGEPVPVPLSA